MEENIDYWMRITPFELSEPDKRALVTKTDEEWNPHTWSELKIAIAHQDLGSLTRYPSDMRKYLLWRREMNREYPDISKYIITKRLEWDLPMARGFTPRSSTPLADTSDYKIRRNDWSYGVERDVSHIVIWLKTPIETNQEGELTTESSELLEAFVQKTFRDKMSKEYSKLDAEIIWFKNPVKWQSVRTLEHFHVLTKGVDDSLIREWTGQGLEDTIGHSWQPGAANTDTTGTFAS